MLLFAGEKKTEEEFAALETETAELLAQLEEGQQRFKLLDGALLKTQTKKKFCSRK